MNSDINPLTKKARLWRTGEHPDPLWDAIDKEVREALEFYLSGVRLSLTDDYETGIPLIQAEPDSGYDGWEGLGLKRIEQPVELSDFAFLIGDQEDINVIEGWEAVGRAILDQAAKARAAIPEKEAYRAAIRAKPQQTPD